MPATLHSVEQRFMARKLDLSQRQGQKALLDHQYAQAVAEREIQEQLRERYEKCAELLLKASGTARDLVKTKIEELVTWSLTGITGDPYQFKMEMVQSAGNWSVNFVVITPEGVELDPLESCGGGIADIISMTLRIAVLAMYEPVVEGPIILDENFKFLSRGHIRTAAEWLHTLHEKLGRQIILVTHVPELAAAADRCFEVVPRDGTSYVEDITGVTEAE